MTNLPKRSMRENRRRRAVSKAIYKDKRLKKVCVYSGCDISACGFAVFCFGHLLTAKGGLAREIRIAAINGLGVSHSQRRSMPSL